MVFNSSKNFWASLWVMKEVTWSGKKGSSLTLGCVPWNSSLTKYIKRHLTWPQNGNPTEELSLSISKDTRRVSPDIVPGLRSGMIWWNSHQNKHDVSRSAVLVLYWLSSLERDYNNHSGDIWTILTSLSSPISLWYILTGNDPRLKHSQTNERDHRSPVKSICVPVLG